MSLLDYFAPTYEVGQGVYSFCLSIHLFVGSFIGWFVRLSGMFVNFMSKLNVLNLY